MPAARISGRNRGPPDAPPPTCPTSTKAPRSAAPFARRLLCMPRSPTSIPRHDRPGSPWWAVPAAGPYGRKFLIVRRIRRHRPTHQKLSTPATHGCHPRPAPAPAPRPPARPASPSPVSLSPRASSRDRSSSASSSRSSDSSRNGTRSGRPAAPPSAPGAVPPRPGPLPVGIRSLPCAIPPGSVLPVLVDTSPDLPGQQRCARRMITLCSRVTHLRR